MIPVIAAALLTLVFVLAFVFGIGAGITVPAYQDYGVKAKMTEVLAGTSGLQADVAVQMAHSFDGELDSSTLPDIQSNASTLKGKYFDSVTVDRKGVISVLLGNNIGGNPTMNGQTFTLTPVVEKTGLISKWTCTITGDAARNKYLPASCRDDAEHIGNKPAHQQSEASPAGQQLPLAEIPLPPTDANGKYAVSFGAYASQSDADEVIARLKQSQLPGFSVADTINEKPAWRVRIGPYTDRAQAEIVRLEAVKVSSDVNAQVIALDSVDAATSANSSTAPANPAPLDETPPTPFCLAGLPNITGMSYGQARRKLLDMGLSLVAYNGSDDFTGRQNFREVGFIEVQTCTAAGMYRCVGLFSTAGKSVKVVMAGETEPTDMQVEGYGSDSCAPLGDLPSAPE
jgi:Tfp pilus assembly major pilin PilA